MTASQHKLTCPSTPARSFPIAESKEMWYKTTVGSVAAIVTPFTLYVLYKEATHHHHEHGTVYPHMHVRAKAFPWAENGCDLFDLECKQHWRDSHKKQH